MQRNVKLNGSIAGHTMIAADDCRQCQHKRKEKMRSLKRKTMDSSTGKTLRQVRY